MLGVAFTFTMAVQPDVLRPVMGYFVTSEFVEVITYVNNLINHHQCSVVFILHASALFEREGVIQELHLPINQPIILDPQMPEDLIYHLIEEQYHIANEPDHYENIEGSGWSFIPGTIRWWFKVYMCQPNSDANPTKKNVSEPDDDNPDDPPEPHRPREYNYLLYAVVEYYARKNEQTIPRIHALKYPFLEYYNDIACLGFPKGDFELNIQMQDLPEYHAGLNLLNLRVFSMRGNILYAKQYQPDTYEFIDLYLNSSNKFALVLNLHALFKKKHDRHFCMNCVKWVGENHHCEKVLLTSKKDDVLIPDIPWGRHALTGYADFESYIDNTDRHYISGWGAMFVDGNHEVFDSQYENLTTTESLIKSFVEYCTKTSINFSQQFDGPTDNCQICNHLIIDNAVLYGRNFINGKSGSHHYDCWNHQKNTMYVFFHNFRGYDSHFLIKELVANTTIEHMSASSMEKFNAITILGWESGTVNTYDKPYLRITYKDTFNFFTCSLAKCVSMIEDWRYTPVEGRKDKGLFPYDWFNDPEKLYATSLPPAPWHNKLTNAIVDAQPAYALWQEKNFKYFYEYHDYYMMLDVLQLCDAFEEFRRTCVSEFQTDPAHFQGAPGLTWYLGVCQNPKMFKIILDKGVYMHIQNSIRGGISQAMTRYINVENKPNESMFFLDVNSLYSACMTKKMPGKYLYSESVLPDNWQELYNAESEQTAFMLVDLVYPEHLHDRDWAYPLAPHKYNDRLCTTFKNRELYLVHAETLAFYLERGMILEYFHYMYIFEQDYTLRDYVQSNIEKRRHTNSEVMKTLYKLLNNSLYGKTCENVNKYRKFAVVNDESILDDELEGPINAELADCTNIIDCGSRLLVEKKLTEVRLNKPIQIGFAILEFAKLHIYKFLAAIQDHFGERVVPLYTDTDSLLFWCDFKEPWKEFYNSPLRPFLDFEKVPDFWGIKTKDTDKQSGLWAPEANGKEIVEYCGLRAKCYAYRFRDNTEVIKNKGVPKVAMIANQDETPREKITMQHYRDALFDGKQYYVTQFAIRSFKHEVITKTQYKLGISANDLKRAVTSDRAISLPFGYRGELFQDLITDCDDTSYLDA